MTMLTAKQAAAHLGLGLRTDPDRLEFLRGLGYYSPVLPDTM